MEQVDFSKHAEDYIRRNHSNLTNRVNYKDDGSFDCLIPSSRGVLSIWIATYDKEITIGFEDSDGNSESWHTHMSLFGASNLEEELIAMSKLIDSIISDREPIVFSSKLGYRLTDDLDEETQAADDGEEVVVYRWSEL